GTSKYESGDLMNIALGLLLVAFTPVAQNANDTPEAHVSAAKSAAGDDFQNLFNFQCNGPGPGGNRGAAGGAQRGQGGGQPRGAGGGGGQRQAGPPERSTWHAEPVKVFDNLYF